MKQLIRYTKNSVISNLLYAIFESYIDNSFSENKRIILITFESPEQLLSWIENANCCQTINISSISADVHIELLAENYPEIYELMHSKPESIAIVLLSRSTDKIYCLSAMITEYRSVDAVLMRKTFPKHIKLKQK